MNSTAADLTYCGFYWLVRLELPSSQHFCDLKSSLDKLLWSFEGDKQCAVERDFCDVLFYLNFEKSTMYSKSSKKTFKRTEQAQVKVEDCQLNK